VPIFMPDNYATLNKINSRQIDLVIILGSNTSVNYANQLPWISAEIEFTKTRIEQGLPLIGICFGGQIIAVAAGANVRTGSRGKEIGFHQLTLTENGNKWPTMKLLSEVFEFHGETFDVPHDGVLLASTEKYPQAFLLGNCCLAMQFHLEIAEHEFGPLISEFFDYTIGEHIDLNELKQKMKNPVIKEQAKLFLESIIRQFLSQRHKVDQCLGRTQNNARPRFFNSAEYPAIRKNPSYSIFPDYNASQSTGKLQRSKSSHSFFDQVTLSSLSDQGQQSSRRVVNAFKNALNV
jgi:GMP synthase-like glutamine amidotransferase